MQPSLLPVILCFILLFPALAQEPVPLPDWKTVSADNAGRLYITTASGDLLRRDFPPLIYSPSRKSAITLVDVTNPLRPFLFYEGLQEYVLLDRFLTETGRYSLEAFTSYAGIVAPSLNNQLWVLDMVDFSIKKADPQFGQVLIRIPLPQVLDPGSSEFTSLREYQNLLFLADRNSGIYLFDNMGNYLRRIDVRGVEHLYFDGDMLYFTSTEHPGRLFTENLYRNSGDVIELPVDCRSVIIHGDSAWYFTQKELITGKRPF